MMDHYRSFIDTWDNYATVRSRPRRLIDANHVHEVYHYPISRMPVAVHPIVAAKGDSFLKKMLAQACVFYLKSIASLETEVINKAALTLINGNLSHIIPEPLKLDLLSIVVDEAYHAHVARDYSLQLKNLLDLPDVYANIYSDLGHSITKHMSDLKPDCQDDFLVIAVCIGEHTLTPEIASMGREENVASSFTGLMKDHVTDEGRHATLFKHVLKLVWANLTLIKKQSISKVLPHFVKEYLSESYAKKFIKDLLLHEKISEQEVDKIMKESFHQCYLGENNSSFRNICKLFQSSSLLDDPLLVSEFQKNRIDIGIEKCVDSTL